MPLSEQTEQIIKQLAGDYVLPAELIRAFVLKESTGNPEATRYEKAFYMNYMKPLERLTDADKKRRATSWGLMQIMGQTARERGFTGEFEELFVPKIGLYWGCRQLVLMKERHFKRWGWDGVIAAYNAGSPRLRKDGKFINQDYVDKVRHFWGMK